MTNFCLVALILSVSLLVLAVVGSAYLHKQQRKRGKEEEGSVPISPFRLFLIGFFLACVALFFPVYYLDYFTTEVAVAREFKSLLLSLHNTMRIFILDGDFDTIGAVVSNTENVRSAVGVAYSVYGAVSR